jgi:hypothetical protein
MEWLNEINGIVSEKRQINFIYLPKEVQKNAR